MILVESDKEWPYEWIKTPSSAFREKKDASLRFLVVNGIHLWYMKTGYKPTHLLIGPNAKRKLKKEMDLQQIINIPISKNIQTYLGLVIKCVDEDGLEILCDIPNI